MNEAKLCRFAIAFVHESLRNVPRLSSVHNSSKNDFQGMIWITSMVNQFLCPVGCVAPECNIEFLPQVFELAL